MCGKSGRESGAVGDSSGHGEESLETESETSLSMASSLAGVAEGRDGEGREEA